CARLLRMRFSASLRGLLAGGGLFNDAHDVGLLHDQEILAVDLDLGARPLAEQHAVADLEVDRDQLAGLVAPAGADGDDLALRGLLLGGVGNDDAALGFFVGFNALDDHAIVQRTEFHEEPPRLWIGPVWVMAVAGSPAPTA